MDPGSAAASPLPFRDPAAEGRIGVVDIGSNSVRLVVFETGDGTTHYLFNEKVLCGLGANLDRTGRLNPEGRARALRVLQRFACLCRRLGVHRTLAVATAAVREAGDGAAFVAEVAAATGLEVHVTSGEEEARYSACGVLLGAPDAEGLVADLGGASLELAEIGRNGAGAAASLAIGPLRQSPEITDRRAQRQSLDARLGDCPLLHRRHRRLYLVGGSWRTLARLHMTRTRYPLPVLQAYTLRGSEARKLASWASRQTATSLARFSDASPSRLRVTPYGGLVLQRLIRFTGARRVILSAFGLREGVLFAHLPASRRSQDPLLDACAALERRHARCPGYGDELYRWLRPLFPEFRRRRRRLMRAACLASDVEWREHPDYRAAIAFEALMRVDVAGVDHAQRLFLALALLFRHKGARRAAARLDVLGLVEERWLQAAERLGRAMRVAGHFTGSSTGILPHCPLRLEDDRLVLSVDDRFAGLVGEVVATDLDSLGQLLGREVRIECGGNVTPADRIGGSG